METDAFGNPVGTQYPGEDGCPEGMMCIPEDEFHLMLTDNDMQYTVEGTIEPAGDAEAIIDFTQTLLTLDFWTLVSFSIPLTIMAIYGLSIYAGFKWIQRKFT